MHAIPDQSLETVRNAVREQWKQEQSVRRDKKPTQAPPKTRNREPDEPDRD